VAGKAGWLVDWACCLALTSPQGILLLSQLGAHQSGQASTSHTTPLLALAAFAWPAARSHCALLLTPAHRILLSLTCADGVAVKYVGAETFRMCRELVDGVVLVDNAATSAAIKVRVGARGGQMSGLQVGSGQQACVCGRVPSASTRCRLSFLSSTPPVLRLRTSQPTTHPHPHAGRLQRDAVHPGAGRRGGCGGRQGVPAALRAQGADRGGGDQRRQHEL